MRKKLIPILMMVFVTILGSCVKDDIADLQKQIDNLDTKVDEMEQAQQEALLAEIADLKGLIAQMQADMEAGNTELANQYASLLNSLQLLEDEVANNAAAVYYGNLLTDEDFAAFTAQGATIVTGKIIATTQNHNDALTVLKMVQGDLVLMGGSTIDLTALQNAGGSIQITGLSTSGTIVKFPVLASVGENFIIEKNSALESVTADAVILINNHLESTENPLLATLSFNSLDQVGSISVNEYLADDPNYIGLGSLTTLNLSATNVLGDLDIQYISGGTLIIGEVDGSFYLSNTNFTELVVGSEVIEGDFTFQYNGNLTSIDFSSIKTIEGNVSISYNATDWYDWLAPKGLETLPAFAALESIGGDVRIEGNSYLTNLETFNSVTSFTGSQIYVSGNGSAAGLTYINLFNALEDGGPSTYTKIDINIIENTAWFNGFNALLEANNINLNVAGILDPMTWMNGTIKIDGFALMTACKSLQLNAKNAEAFTAFASLDNFKGFGVTNCLVCDMPDDTNVGMCSMEPIFTKILNGDFDSKPAIFKYNWATIDNATAIDQLLAPCIQ